MKNNFVNAVKDKFKDKYTKRGTVYSVLGFLGIFYELIFRQSETLVIIFYSAIIGIGFILIFYLQEQT